MSTPLTVREEEQRQPFDRPQKVRIELPVIVVDVYEYYKDFLQIVANKWTQYSLWGFPWWTLNDTSAPITGGFDHGFSSGFEGGIDSPQASGFSFGFSDGFH